MNLFSFEHFVRELCCVVLLSVTLCVNIVPGESRAVTFVQRYPIPFEGGIRFDARAIQAAANTRDGLPGVVDSRARD